MPYPAGPVRDELLRYADKYARQGVHYRLEGWGDDASSIKNWMRSSRTALETLGAQDVGIDEALEILDEKALSTEDVETVVATIDSLVAALNEACAPSQQTPGPAEGEHEESPSAASPPDGRTRRGWQLALEPGRRSKNSKR